MGTAGGESSGGAREGHEGVPELSPQQLQLVQQHFDRVRTNAGQDI